MTSISPATSPPITNTARAALGFGFGLLVMVTVVQVFVVNHFDFDNIVHGTRMLVSGVNPWAAETRIDHFYNPPFSVLFLWPLLFVTPKVGLVVGGALLFAFVFYHRAWAGLAWFGTNSALWLIASGGIDMLVIGAGLTLLLAGDNAFSTKRGLVWRVLAYGVLLIKPQGGIYLVVLYNLTRRDWKGLLISAIVYGLPFLPWYPAWLDVLLHNPPLAQTEAAHAIWARFGPIVAGIIAVGVIAARRWQYWQLGGALAGILTPYGMPGMPIFLTLTGVKSLKGIPIVVLWSGCLAALTWVNPPPGADYYAFISPLMAIYQLSMLGLALALACVSPDAIGLMPIAVVDWGKTLWRRLRQAIRPISPIG